MKDLEKLFSYRGISSSYWNYKGEYVDVPEANRLNIARAMGVVCESVDEVAAANSEIELAKSKRVLPKLTIKGREDRVISVVVPGALKGDRFNLSIFTGSSKVPRYNLPITPGSLEVREHFDHANTHYVSCDIQIDFTAFSYGYHRLAFTHVATQQTSYGGLAIVPQKCFQPTWLSHDRRCSGVIVQLYTLRSETNLGIGDLSDLYSLIGLLAEVGFDSIGLNPLHALLPDLDQNCSPYSPSDRTFVSPLYVALDKVPEYHRALGSNATLKTFVEKQSTKLRKLEFIDYAGVKRLKLKLFTEAHHQLFHDKAESALQRQKDVAVFKRENGAPLLRYALIESVYLSGGELNDARHVSKLADDSQEYINLLAQHSARVEVLIYAQWLAQTQLAACQKIAQAKGMVVGLVNDLAVGADRTGTEVLGSDIFCSRAAIGAPPDEIAPVGQNWGLPPLDPYKLEHSGFDHFIRLLRANMKNCGALRIDHVMSLTRLWWCPVGANADKGGYVNYPFEQMLGLLRLESHLNKCAVIGEDLGIVPENFRERLYDAGVLSNKVFYFERHSPGVFKHPAEYNEFALAMVNNHDIPTLCSWWNGADIQLRESLKALEIGKTADQLMAIRYKEKENLISHLVYGDMLPDEWHGKDINDAADQSLVFAIMLWVAQAKSKLFAIELEDLMLMTDPINVPGTFKEYPNWKRKLTHTLDETFEKHSVKTLLKAISQKRQ